MKDIIRIQVSRQGEEEFFRFLAQRNVIFMLARMDQGSSEPPVNPVRTIDVIRQASTSESVAGAIVAWIKSRAARNAVIYTPRRERVYARDLDTGELEHYLEIAEQISLIDAGANHRPDQLEPLVGG